MTVETTGNSVVYQGNDVAVEFDFPFKTLDEDHLSITRRDVSTGLVDYTYTDADFTITGIGDAEGGTVELNDPLASGYEIVIERTVPYTQALDIVNQSGFYPQSIEDQFDLIEMQVQQVASLSARSVLVAVGETLPALPAAGGRAGLFLAFDASGNPIMSSGTGADASLRVDLAADGGFTLVKHKSALSGTFGRTGRQWALVGGIDDRNLFNWIDDELDSGVLDGSNIEPLTSGVQAFVDYLADRHCHGYAPPGTFLVDDTINFPATYGWGVIAGGSEGATWEQATDNIPIFDLGATPVDTMHSCRLSNMQFKYSNSQPAANTAANCLLFSAEALQVELQSIRFFNGFYGLKVQSGIPAPWGEDWNNLQFTSGLTGGAMDWTGSTLGTPNNQWGRFFVNATNMTDTIFKNLVGYNWTIGTIELLNATNLQLLKLQAGSTVEIGALKLELAQYDATVPDNILINAQVGASIRLGSFDLGGTWCVLTPTTGTFLFGGDGGRIEVGHAAFGATEATSNFYLCGGSTKEYLFREKEFRDGGFGVFTIPLTNTAGTTTANKVTVWPDKNDRLSDNKGDAAYTIAQGDPGTIVFETTLTASRTVALPVDAALLFNGLRYHIISNGAVNGANTLVIAASGNTKATIIDPHGYVIVEWRRHPTAHLGWQVITAGSVRPSALAVVPTANLPAAAAALDGTALIEDAGVGDRNLIIYAGAERFRVDGGAGF